MRSWQLFAGILALAIVSGCGDSPKNIRLGGDLAGGSDLAPAQKRAGGGVRGGGATEGMPSDALVMAKAIDAQQPDAGGEPVRTLPQKIIRTGDVHLIVDNFDIALGKFKQAVDAIKGAYIAKAEIGGSAGTPRYGTWQIRVPAAAFDTFMGQLAGLGVPEKNVIDSRDVTEEFYDLEARLRNKKAEEARLVKHLETSTGKLDEILKVEHEISRVRGEIEQMEGRLRMIDNLATLTTVTLAIREIKDYVPAQAPTFTTKIQRTFSDSTDALTKFGEVVVLILVGLAPWLPLLAIAGICVYICMRIVRRRILLNAQTPAAPPVT